MKKITLTLAFCAVTATGWVSAITFSDQIEPFRLKHEEVVGKFKKSQNNGLSRIVPTSMRNPSLEKDPPRHEDLVRDWEYGDMFVTVGSRHYLATKFNLMSLLLQEKPLVYVVKEAKVLQQEREAYLEAQKQNPAAARRFSSYTSRQLTATEAAGLAELLKGKDFVNLSEPGTNVFIGAIRADVACLKCHETKKAGDLLGAFLYDYEESEARWHDR